MWGGPRWWKMHWWTICVLASLFIPEINSVHANCTHTLHSNFSLSYNSRALQPYLEPEQEQQQGICIPLNRFPPHIHNWKQRSFCFSMHRSDEGQAAFSWFRSTHGPLRKARREFGSALKLNCYFEANSLEGLSSEPTARSSNTCINTIPWFFYFFFLGSA